MANNKLEEKIEEKATEKIEEIAKKKAEEKKKAKLENKKEKIYIVKTPVPNFNGEVAGVQFAYGKAEVKEGWILDWFKEKGYGIEEK